MDATANVTAAIVTAGQGNVIWAYIMIVAVLALVPHLVDIIYAYKAKNNIRKLLLDLAEKGKLDHKECEQLIKEAGKSPRGISGLSRGTMAIAVIVIMGIALFHLLTTRTAADSQVIGNVLSMLGSLIAAIIGFYFGGKAVMEAGESKEAAEKKNTGTNPPPPG